MHSTFRDLLWWTTIATTKVKGQKKKKRERIFSFTFLPYFHCTKSGNTFYKLFGRNFISTNQICSRLWIMDLLFTKKCSGLNPNWSYLAKCSSCATWKRVQFWEFWTTSALRERMTLRNWPERLQVFVLEKTHKGQITPKHTIYCLSSVKSNTGEIQMCSTFSFGQMRTNHS